MRLSSGAGTTLDRHQDNIIHLSIITFTNIFLNVLVVPLLPILLVLVTGVKGVHHLNHIVPIPGVKSIQILISAWIRWSKTGSDWDHSLDIALILTISWGGTTKIEA